MTVEEYKARQKLLEEEFEAKKRELDKEYCADLHDIRKGDFIYDDYQRGEVISWSFSHPYRDPLPQPIFKIRLLKKDWSERAKPEEGVVYFSRYLGKKGDEK